MPRDSSRSRTTTGWRRRWMATSSCGPWVIVGRNLRLFFRDRMNVFFSLLGAIVLFLLYVLFLANVQTQALAATLPDASVSDIHAFVDSWMFAGIVLLTTVTTGLGA